MARLNESAKTWPPPPDLESLKELFAVADVERLIVDLRCPMDEYDPEAKCFLEAINGWTQSELVTGNILPVLEDLWQNQFSLDDQGVAKRRTALAELARQIVSFFGTDASPSVRQAGHNA